MTDEVTVRRAQLHDGEATFALAKDFATSFAVERAAFASAFAQVLGHPDALCLVASIRGAVVGYCLAFDHPTFFANGRVSWIEEIAVRADQRRLGVGRSLMAAVEEWARSRESRLIGLATRRAADFYSALEYQESATYFRKVLT